MLKDDASAGLGALGNASPYEALAGLVRAAPSLLGRVFCRESGERFG